ncbi:RagB/SusD family nutrient uptake outer membrane protein [Chitinophaga qingshengii]|uniref:RagB/SusD family nutrient uptake outer membrane protein n=1 Tax=Chitinophaga qingshengii TaxID=1569794 RepID=A0ABR7TGX4_9BACT|nr:RagB/SusD family nutrient uptake outer membrane protein [Chitinophaga qingshengii]MBC9929736.1 RagB/SusD family nutrient uptake outer membrane protein [Chitinophaga qingshengii]
MQIHYKYIIAACLLLLLGTGCSKKLDKAPLSQFSNENFWKSEGDAMLALAAVYRGNIAGGTETTMSDWWSYYGLLLLDMSTDNLYDRRGDNSDVNKLTSGGLTATNGQVGIYWNTGYLRIARCNYFLENVNKVPASPDKIKRMTAEARFIRAAIYFYFSQYFGSVPLTTKTLTVDEANTVKKATKAEIVNFVMAELTAAAADLPRFKDLPASEKGRASKQAALAFLGRMQLAEKKYGDAAATYKTIIDFNDNIIDANYKSLFDGTNESSKELVFAIQYVPNLVPNGMLQHFFPAVNSGWHLVNPLGSLAESYEFKDGTPFSFTDPRYNPKDVGANRDPRLGYTILYNMQTFNGRLYITHPDSTKSVDQLTLTRQATRTGYCIRKFLPDNFSGDLQNSGIDVPVIRYAEILLSYLEAKLEAGEAIDQGLLDATINQVRARASVGMPPVTVIDPTALRVILRRERRNELACEGLRYWDLLRWGTIAQVLNGSFYGAAFPGAVNLRKNGSTVDPYSRWFVTTKAFRAGTDEKWPIPQSEQDINPNLR